MDDLEFHTPRYNYKFLFKLVSNIIESLDLFRVIFELITTLETKIQFIKCLERLGDHTQFVPHFVNCPFYKVFGAKFKFPLANTNFAQKIIN